MKNKMVHQTSSPKIEKTQAKAAPIDYKAISRWNIDAVCKWLESIEYQDADKYFREHRINGLALLMLTEEDLKEIIKHNVGQRKNLYHLIRMLQIKYNRFMNGVGSGRGSMSLGSDLDDDDDDEDDDDLNGKTNGDVKGFLNSLKTGEESAHHISYDNPSDDEVASKSSTTAFSLNSTHRHLINESHREDKEQNAFKDEADTEGGGSPSVRHRGLNGDLAGHLDKEVENVDDEDEDYNQVPNFCENCLKKFDRSPYTSYAPNLNRPIHNYKGEKRKTLVSLIYLFLTTLWTSFMLTVVHDRVPDMQKYPPLPDLILDNVPLIPWAFFATELIGLFLGITILVILFFHKYRMIIFRRICSLGGTIFFLRSITMLITSLSVPGIHIQCSSQRYGSLMNKLSGAWNILMGVGLYVQGVRTCGDYMFSGHTVWLTLTTHFITEYTPPSMAWLHTGCWILNVFGLFFILGAHEHYSIDVFVAFYITSRLFLYYHSLSNNKVLFQRDHKRVKIWFPLFSYFESNIHSIVPNQYECPTRIFHSTYRFAKKIVKKIFGFKSKKAIH